MFFLKDNLIDYYNEHGKFPPQYPKANLPSRPWPKMIVSFWIMLLTFPMAAGFIYMLVFGSWTVVLTVGVVLLIGK